MTDAKIDALLERLQNAVEEILELRKTWPVSPEREARIDKCWREIKTANGEIEQAALATLRDGIRAAQAKATGAKAYMQTLRRMAAKVR